MTADLRCLYNYKCVCIVLPSYSESCTEMYGLIHLSEIDGQQLLFYHIGGKGYFCLNCKGVSPQQKPNFKDCKELH